MLKLILAASTCLATFILSQAQQNGAPPDPTGPAPPTTQPAAQESPAAASVETAEATPEDDADIEPPREPTASEILEALSRESDAPGKPVTLPARPSQQVRIEPREVSPSALPKNAIVPVRPKLYPDGYRIVDRPGRLSREGDYYIFAFESRSETAPELPIRLLPNRLLEDMEIISAGGTKPVVFLVSGELTAYHGVNYLLVQKLLTRPELGNLK